MQITTTGIVLREREHDDDRILTILTADRGVITAYARGAKKLRGRLLSGTELLCCSRFVLFQYRDRYQVDSAGDAFLLCPEPGIREGQCMVTDGRGALQIVGQYDFDQHQYVMG